MTSYVEDALFPASTNAVIESGLLMVLAALETESGAKVAAKPLNMPASELAFR